MKCIWLNSTDLNSSFSVGGQQRSLLNTDDTTRNITTEVWRKCCGNDFRRNFRSVSATRFIDARHFLQDA